jgi:hypothetical protein
MLSFLPALLLTGCTVTGSAFVERDLPDGRAVAQIQVNFTPPLPGQSPDKGGDVPRPPSRRARSTPDPLTDTALGTAVSSAPHEAAWHDRCGDNRR